MCHKYSLKRSLKNFVIDPEKWESVPMERATWRRAIHNGANPGREQQAGQSSEEESEPTAIDGKWHSKTNKL